jgi:hypothetical protein
MQRTARRFACLAAWLGLIMLPATQARAASYPATTTLPATSVTSTSAIAQGTVDTSGAAILWQFDYGRTTRYGLNTPAELITAGHGKVTVAAKLSGLKTLARYHFQLVTQMGDGTYAYPLVLTFGQDRTFTTRRAGRVVLRSTRLSVIHGRALVPVRCASSQPCQGSSTLTARRRTLGRARVLVGAGRKATVSVKLTGAALAMLRSAGSVGATLKARFTSGQPALNRHVSLR